MTTKRRRGNSEGSLFQRPNGSWRAMMSLNGKRLSFSCKTRQEAYVWIKKTTAQVDAGLTYQNANITLEEYLVRWLGNLLTALRPDTWHNYAITCRNYIFPVLGKFKLKDLTPPHIQFLYDARTGDGVNAGTIRVIHAILHMSLKRAVDLGIIPTDIHRCCKTSKISVEKSFNPVRGRDLTAAGHGQRGPERCLV